MKDFETALGRVAIVNADLGAAIAKRAIVDLLERHERHDAAELVEQCGDAAIAAALTAEAWRNEHSPEDPTAPAISPRPTGKETA